MESENEIILSVIIPIFNVEKYLNCAMKSVLDSKIEDGIEIILVDDGSTDSSGRIADEYLRRKENIKVYHKENGGLSDARNYGFHKSVGKYVFFMDSDDMVDSKALSTIVNRLRHFNGDAILWDASIIDSQGWEIKNKEKEIYFTHKGVSEGEMITGRALIEQQLLDHGDFVTTVWLGAYKREFINNNFLFEKDILHEDELWTPKILLQAESVMYIPQKIYKYRIRDNSIMTGTCKDRSKNINSLIYIFSTMYAYYNWKISDNEFKRKLKGNLSKRYLHKISEYDFYAYKNLSRYVDKRCILRNAHGVKDKIRAAILFFSGKLYCFLTKSIAIHGEESATRR